MANHLKILATILAILLTPLSASGQAMEQQDMQQMMQKMQKMQACMAKIDQSELKAMEQTANEFQLRLKSLCDKGKRDKAQDLAIKYGKEISQSKSMKQMKECAKLIEGAIPPTMMPSYDDYQNKNVCDTPL